MTKAQLIAKVAAELELSRKHVAGVCDAFLDALGDSLADGEEIHLSGFGVFMVKKKEAHTARNPKTGDSVEIPASNRVNFAASKILKEKINS